MSRTASPRARRNPSVEIREHGLALIRRVNRWLLTGAVGVAGVVSLVASQSFHGHTLTAVRAASGRSSSAQSSSAATSSGSGGAIQTPAQAPAPAGGESLPSAPVVSGGS